MDYKDFIDKVGLHFDIIEGELVESPEGPFVVSYTYKPFSVYLNKLTEKYMLIAPETSYLGHEYKFKYRDCITLMARWLDSRFNSGFGNIYNKLSHKDFLKYYKSGMSLWYEDNGFQKVTNNYQEGDCIVYEYHPLVISHVGIYLNDNKILHHLPEKLSCIDTIDYSKILGVYRYGN